MKALLITTLLCFCFVSFAYQHKEMKVHEPYTPVHIISREPYTAVHPDCEEAYTPLTPFKTEEEIEEEKLLIMDMGITPAVYN
ncbi:hypothetical protein QTN25_006087 [Entamoeba marina]